MDYRPLPQLGDTIDAEGARRLVEAFLFDGWNSHDPERVLVCTTDDVSWQDPFLPNGVAHGHAAVREWLLHMWQLDPNTTFELIDDVYLSSDRTKIAAPWRIIDSGMVGVDLYGLRGSLIAQVRTLVGLPVTSAVRPVHDGE